MAAISDAGLARIIAAVGIKATEWPIDGDGLRGCLKLAYRRYRDAVQYTSTASYKTQLRRLAQIRKTAKRLELLIGSVDIREWAEDVPPSPSKRFTTTDLVNAIDEQLKSWPEPDEVIIDLSKSIIRSIGRSVFISPAYTSSSFGAPQL